MNNWIKLLLITIAVAAFGHRVGAFFKMSPPMMAGGFAFLTLLYGFLLIREHEKLRK